MAARAFVASTVLAALAAQAFVGVVEARSAPGENAQGDVKKPDCVPGVDPRSFVPGISGGHGGITPVPSHGGITPVPPHGGYGSPPHGGSGALPDPAHGGFGTSPSAPSGGGAYGGSPTTPSHGGGAYGGGSPATPSTGGFGTTTPMPSVPVDPHSPSSLPGSCDYWRSHPMEIWSAIGGRFPTSMGHFFGGTSDMSIQDALADTRSDGAGALLREGAAALLNSLTRAGFPYTTDQVRDAYAAAAAGGSDSAAAAQAAAFKKANEAARA